MRRKGPDGWEAKFGAGSTRPDELSGKCNNTLHENRINLRGSRRETWHSVLLSSLLQRITANVRATSSLERLPSSPPLFRLTITFALYRLGCAPVLAKIHPVCSRSCDSQCASRRRQTERRCELCCERSGLTIDRFNFSTASFRIEGASSLRITIPILSMLTIPNIVI